MQASQPVGNLLLFQNVRGRVRTSQPRRMPPPLGRKTPRNVSRVRCTPVRRFVGQPERRVRQPPLEVRASAKSLKSWASSFIIPNTFRCVALTPSIRGFSLSESLPRWSSGERDCPHRGNRRYLQMLSCEDAVPMPSGADIFVVVVARLGRRFSLVVRGYEVAEKFLMFVGIDALLQAPDEVRHIVAVSPDAVDLPVKRRSEFYAASRTSTSRPSFLRCRRRCLALRSRSWIWKWFGARSSWCTAAVEHVPISPPGARSACP